ncbi:enoyl-CoA hydratase/isomerase family protein [Rhodococcus sp. T7]|uniref:enoyl-CoA hydratase/isomerase family protein n=1 Tax=Rhodococcus sp. T7 TaxID=627444 RepID=UPI00135A41F8|nr:enoyl-CoA hydratase-related protein [Rhodococcus sp. T7]KAF0956988.1 Enoyl-CoA-hydratase [Rhodococcus sp. T7]KAF0958693.1 Enoyl-CoA-hydratase [Rhodococcus sp. T7]
MDLSYTALTVDRHDDGVAEISLSRPKLFNRVDAVLHRELADVIERISTDRTIRAVVLGSTGKAFSAGGDFELMQAAHGDVMERRAIVDDGRRLLQAFVTVPQPIVAAVQGPAIGLGATLVLLCDIVVAARAATLADSHVALGLVAGDGGCLVWPQAAGMVRARRHLLTGDPLDAETAFGFGMVTDLVDDADEVLPAARSIASRVARLAPLAVQGTKRALNRVTQQRAGEVVDLSFAYEEHTLASDDLLEGIAAFQERRDANFRGR